MIALRLPLPMFHCFIMSILTESPVPVASCFLLEYCWFLLTTGLALVLKHVMKEALATDEELCCKVDACRGSYLLMKLGRCYIVFSGVLCTCSRSFLWQWHLWLPWAQCVGQSWPQQCLLFCPIPPVPASAS